MSDDSSFLILERSCDEAIDWVARQINLAGMRVVRTFDLQAARHDQTSCPCPHHGQEHCDCQMVVLLVYGARGQIMSESQPVSIIAHGYNGVTRFSVVDTPQQRADPSLETAIRLALAPRIESLSRVQNKAG